MLRANVGDGFGMCPVLGTRGGARGSLLFRRSSTRDREEAGAQAQPFPSPGLEGALTPLWAQAARPSVPELPEANGPQGLGVRMPDLEPQVGLREVTRGQPLLSP